MITRTSVLLLAGAVLAGTAAARPVPIPRIETANGRHGLVVDGEPFVILGAQAHNSSAWPATLPRVWPAMDRLGVNTVELPVYWEQVEPSPGRFDFGVVDSLLAGARAHGKRLVLLWFGTWKNGSAHYRPAWMKARPDLYPNIVDRTGRPVDSPSPHSAAALKADVRAFAAFMRHLREVDPKRTIIMVQVENEPGSWGSARDFSPAAERTFGEPVPPAVLCAMGRPVGTPVGWRAAFGDEADGFFQAWSIARYIERVAAAGKAAYPLPLYVNVALKDPFQAGPVPPYEFGGATHDVIPIWKVAAPSIDVLAPDVYERDPKRYLAVLDQYARPDNALLVPEAIRDPDYVRFLYAALSRGAIGFSPFGIDAVPQAADDPDLPQIRDTELAQLAISYRAIEPMSREVAAWAREGRLSAAIEGVGEGHEATIDLGDWSARIGFGVAPRGEVKGNQHPVGRVLVARLSADEFVVTGNYAVVRFAPAGRQAGHAWEYLTVEEGRYVDGAFRPERIWNGDETDWGLNFGAAPQVLRVRLSRR